MNKRTAITLTCILSALFIWTPVTYAQTPASPSATTQSLKERIQKVVQENSDKIRGVIDDLNPRERGFIGQVSRLTAEAITVRTPSGQEIITLDTEKEVALTKNDRAISIDDIAVDDWVLVLGVTAEDIFTAKKIRVSSSTLRPNEYTATLGGITEVTRQEITIKPRNQETTVTYDLTRTTEYQNLTGETISFAQVDDEAQVLVVGFEDDDGKTATVVRSLTVATPDE